MPYKYGFFFMCKNEIKLSNLLFPVSFLKCTRVKSLLNIFLCSAETETQFVLHVLNTKLYVKMLRLNHGRNF